MADPLVHTDPGRAQLMLDRATVLSRQLGDVSGEALALMLRGAALLNNSCHAEARDLTSRALELARKCNDHFTTARSLNQLGMIARVEGDYAAATAHFLECLNVAQVHNDELNHARVLINFGVLRMDVGEYTAALDAQNRAAQMMVRLEKAGHATAMSNIIALHYRLGQLSEAVTLADAYLPTVRAHDLTRWEIVIQTYATYALTGLGDAAAAAERARQTLPLALGSARPGALINLQTAYGRALLALNHQDEALIQLEQARHAIRGRGLHALERDIFGALADLWAAAGDWSQAYSFVREQQALERSVQAQDNERRTRVQAMELQLEMQDNLTRHAAEAERRRTTELFQATSALQQARDDLVYRATHDTITSLPNREYFHTEVERRLKAPGRMLGLLLIDLDRFKHVNDTLGHDVGDELLKQVGQRLRSLVRGSDLVARMGGDEFAVLIPELRDSASALRVAHQLLNQLAPPFTVCSQVLSQVLHITASIGVAISPHDGTDATTLQKHADLAMYGAKYGGKNSVRTYSADMGAETAERLVMERDLHVALAEQQFVVHYQGQFNTTTDALYGFEALVRWQHPQRGLVPPLQFIPIAEETGIIRSLGNWVLREVCRQGKHWTDRGHPVSVSVNVSPVQFDSPKFVSTVEHALQDTKLDPAQLVLELTESTVLRNLAAATEQLRRLRALGVRISLDDFGTGQSSLSLLRHIPIDILKIDRSFLPQPQDSQTEQDTTRILLGMLVNLAQALNLGVIAEGVETHEQWKLLQELGCATAQGYLLARPLPAEHIEHLLAPLTSH